MFFFRILLIQVVIISQGVASESGSTADHTQFEVLQQSFQTAPEVTKACLTCHTEAAKQLHLTKHWLWQFEHPETGEILGKKHIINSFCGSIVTNYARCTSCHIGYGWENQNFDFSVEENVDCLVCHDTTGDYKKFPTGAGHPTYQDKVWSQKIWKAPDLTKIAQQVGQTRRHNCGICHFYGGGGDGVKHGDLDSSMNNPTKAIDVHMDVDGLNFSCATCHVGENHDIKGSRYTTISKDMLGIDVPGRGDNSRATCESCHGMTPHSRTINNKINDHTDKVACQTCHIPTFARGEVPTKIWWDWSVAGQMSEDGQFIKRKNAQGEVTYVTQKGEFEWAKNVVPEYAWYAGEIRYTQLEEKIDPNQPVAINTFSGDYNHPNARIWPFKVMRGKQPYDSGNNTLVITHLFGQDKAAYWQSFDWNLAIEVAMKAVGADYSGEYGFVETQMYWPLSHNIAPKEEALGCADCHSHNGRLHNLIDFYLPARDKSVWLDFVGWFVVFGTLIGVLLHGLGRIVMARLR